MALSDVRVRESTNLSSGTSTCEGCQGSVRRLSGCRNPLFYGIGEPTILVTMPLGGGRSGHAGVTRAG